MAREGFVSWTQVEEFKLRSIRFVLISAVSTPSIPVLTVSKRKFNATSHFSPSDICSFIFQSKEIGLQMHEELLKVTNELYTVSPAQPLLPFDIGPPFFSAQGWREANRKSGRTLGLFAVVCLSDSESLWWNVMIHNPSSSFSTYGEGPGHVYFVKVPAVGMCYLPKQKTQSWGGEGTWTHKLQRKEWWIWSQVGQAEVKACSLLTVGP